MRKEGIHTKKFIQMTQGRNGSDKIIREEPRGERRRRMIVRYIVTSPVLFTILSMLLIELEAASLH